MTSYSTKAELVREAREYVPASAVTRLALSVHRLRQQPTVPDRVVWHAAAHDLDRRGYDADRLRRETPAAAPSRVASVLCDSPHHPSVAASEVST